MKEKISIKEKGTSVSANSLIWFGAGVSIAEILTGTYLAPLGFGKGLAAIVLGHVIGCALLFMAGLIGGYTRRSSMETVKMSFGQKGSLLFCGLNVLQLVGWTSIMIYDGGLAANGIFNAGLWVWCLVIGGLIPLSWLPLISDYTREAEKPFRATAASALVYGLVSCFMYVIGMGAAIYTGEYDISVIMVKAGLGAAGLLIIVLSTVTTTFLDAYSAGVSSVSITHRIKEKWAAVAVTIAGTAAAMVYPMDNITDFLYLIGSVFAPMIAIQIADYFIIRQDHEAEEANLPNLLIWLAGFVIYRILMRVDTPVGSTLPDMAVTVVLCVVCRRVMSACCALPGRENVTKV